MTKRYKLISSLCIVLQIILVMRMIIPVLIACSYTFFDADDFSNAIRLQAYKGNTLTVAVKVMANIWTTWQGTFFGNFLLGFSPAKYGGIDSLHVYLIFAAIFLFASLYFALLSMSSVWKIRAVMAGWVYLAVIWSMMSMSYYQEIFYWYTGSVMYTIPLALGMFGTGMAVYAQKKRSIWMSVIAAICVFCMAGGALQIAGVGCYLLLLAAFGFYMRDRKIPMYLSIVFIAALVGAILNVIAPGNYIRHSAIDSSGLHLFSAAKGAVHVVMNGYAGMSDMRFIAISVGSVFLLALFEDKHMEKVIFLIIEFILFIIMPVVNIFPVLLGNSGTDEGSLAARNSFVLMLNCMIILFAIAVLVARIVSIKDVRDVIVIGGFLTILILPKAITIPWDNCLHGTENDLRSGKIQQYSAEINSVVEEIRNSNDSNVIIEQMPTAPGSFREMQISQDPNNWVNTSLASYFGKESIRVR